MKRIVRLTESDLTRIVRRVIMENEMDITSLEAEIEAADENNPPETLLQKIENFISKMFNNDESKFVRSLRTPKIAEKIQRMRYNKQRRRWS